MRHKNDKEDWLKLDNAAKIYPAFASKKDPATFRIAVVMKSDIILECLERALETAILDFPAMALTLRKGLFWAYLDENSKSPHVLQESKMPCTYIDLNKSNGYLFQVYYFDKRISLECFHALTDGYGATEFLKAILFHYLKQIYDVSSEGLRLHGRLPENLEDSYKKYAQPMHTKVKNIYASHIKGTPIGYEGAYVHHGIVSVNALKKIAKSLQTTITILLTALYIKALMPVKKKAPIVVTVPVNLRTLFPSETLRNFSYVMNVIIYQDYDLEDMIKEVSKQFNNQIKKEALQGQFSKNVSFEEQFFLRMMPNVLKSFLLKQARSFKSKRLVTSIVSNPGIIVLPESMQPYISHFETVIYASKPHYINMCVCTYKDDLAISLSRGILEKNIIQDFYLSLESLLDSKIKYYSNEGE